jgi:hypothetical protein
VGVGLGAQDWSAGLGLGQEGIPQAELWLVCCLGLYITKMQDSKSERKAPNGERGQGPGGQLW